MSEVPLYPQLTTLHIGCRRWRGGRHGYRQSYFVEIYGGREVGSYLMLIYFGYHNPKLGSNTDEEKVHTEQDREHDPLRNGGRQAIMAHIRQSRPDSGLGFHAKVLETVQVVFSTLGSRFMTLEIG